MLGGYLFSKWSQGYDKQRKIKGKARQGSKNRWLRLNINSMKGTKKLKCYGSRGSFILSAHLRCEVKEKYLFVQSAPIFVAEYSVKVLYIN